MFKAIEEKIKKTVLVRELNKDESLNQEKKVADFLIGGFKITSGEAHKLFGIMDLPKRVSNLRKEGYSIKSSSISETKHGRKTRHNVYWLEGVSNV